MFVCLYENRNLKFSIEFDMMKNEKKTRRKNNIKKFITTHLQHMNQQKENLFARMINDDDDDVG